MAEPAEQVTLEESRLASGPRPAAVLRELLQQRRGERHLVAIQDFPDPDALSSAFTYREIARGFGIESDILHEGLISHPENLALVNLLELEVIRYTEGMPLGVYDAAVFVDNQGTTTRLAPRVLCVQKSRGTMDTIRTALDRRLLRGGFSLAGVGYVRWSDRDAIPQAADFLLTEENVQTAVVYGILRDDGGREIVSGSLRTGNATLGVDGFLKRALGTDARGRPYGGGRSRAGGFEIDLGFLAGGGAEERALREQKWALFDRQIRRKLFHAAGLETDPGDGPLSEDAER